jgi:hypothetical protein
MRQGVALLGALIATATGICSGTSPAVGASPQEGKALLIGTDTSKMRVLFRKLDDGAILWTSPTTLGTKLSAEPGHHNLNVMCEFKTPGETQMIAGNVAIDLVTGRVYDVAGALDQRSEKCNVTVTGRS